MTSPALTAEQFAELIKPQTGVVKVDQFIDLDRAHFLKERQAGIQAKLSKSRCTKLGSLGSQIAKLCAKRKPDHVIKMAAQDGETKERHGWGRVKPIEVSDVAMVSITRPVRHFLCRHICTDIDMKNCHLVIMDQLYQLFFGHPIPELQQWNQCRGEYFDTLIRHVNGTTPPPAKAYTRDDAKRLAFVWLYEGKVNHFFEELGLDITHPEIKPIYMTAHKLKKHAIELAERIAQQYPQTWESIPTKAKADRIRCSRLSTLLQHIERRCVVDAVMPVVAKNGYIVRDICHDGLLISKGSEPLTDSEVAALMPLLDAAVLAQFGLVVEMVAKPMDEEGAIDLERWMFSSQSLDNCIESDTHAVEVFLQRYNKRIVYCNEEWYIRPLGQYFWRSGEDAVKACISGCEFYKMAGKSKNLYGSNSSGITSIFKALKMYTVDLTNDKFISDTNQRFLGIVHWVDKHMDANGRMFKNDPKSDTAPLVYINRPAPDFSKFRDDDPAMVRLEKLLQGLTDEQRPNYYWIIGRMGFGYVSDKKWLILEGQRHTSKSTLTKIVSLAFGEYCTTVDPPFVAVYNTDSAAKNRWVLTMGCHIKRFAIFAEKSTQTDLNGHALVPVIDGNVVKKILANGGSDQVVTRYHGKSETAVYISCCFLGSLNSMPSSNPRDALDTLIPLTMTRKFTDNEEEIAKYPDLFVKRDQEVADYINDPDVLDHFLWCCLIKHYKPYTFSPPADSDLMKDMQDIRREMGEITPLKVYEDYFISCEKPSEIAWADEVLEDFRVYLGDPNFTPNKLTTFLKKLGHARSKHDYQGKSRPYYSFLQKRG